MQSASQSNRTGESKKKRMMTRQLNFIQLQYDQLKIPLIYRIQLEGMDKYENKYETIEILGEGSFGTVFLIQDQKKKKYALKKIQVNPFKVQQALLQIEIMSRIIHPNLITILESSHSENDNRIEILMEYCEGGDLLTYFKKKNKYLTTEEILNIFRQIVKGFIAMNVKDVMHRDLKPENILLKNNFIKIGDFGCARMAENQEGISRIQNFSLDKGTPIYSSPQQLQNLPYSAKCDVWSAGCLLYFLVYGTHPFMDSTVQKILKKIQELTMHHEIELKEETDPVIEGILKKSLIYKDTERASWRELWLSRYFIRKIDDVEAFIYYQWSVNKITKWMVMQFWKAKKTMDISSQKNQVFAYFTTKFQYSFIAMACDIWKKKPAYAYLFESNTYRQFDNHKDFSPIESIEKDLKATKSLYLSIKEKLKKDAKKIVEEKQMQRESPFADLDNSIRATYQLLRCIVEKLQNQSDLKKTQSSQKSIGEKENRLVWLVMAKWINFQIWFSFERKPRIQDFIKDESKNILKEIMVEMQKYRYGVVE